MKIKLFLIAILCGLGLFSIQGAPDGRDAPPVSSKATILGMKANKHRPKAPSRVFVECKYGEDYMTFSFPGGISSYTVHIYNETDEWYSYVSEEKPTVNIPLFTGTYTIGNRKVKLKARRRFATYTPAIGAKGSKSLLHLEFCFRRKKN